MSEFSIAPYHVKRLSKSGLWAVTSEKLFDVGMLFWRAQEMYESCNPHFRLSPPSLVNFMRWYCTEFSETGEFDYFNTYEGFNLSCETCESPLLRLTPDPNAYDVLFARITSEIRARQGGKYYVVGARAGDEATLEHEIAHGLFYLSPKYREAATRLVENLPAREELFRLLRAEGYADHALVDEAQAYLATGVTTDMAHLEPVRHPFMTLYTSHRKRLIRPEVKQ